MPVGPIVSIQDDAHGGKDTDQRDFNAPKNAKVRGLVCPRHRFERPRHRFERNLRERLRQTDR